MPGVKGIARKKLRRLPRNIVRIGPGIDQCPAVEKACEVAQRTRIRIFWGGD
ncbi:hypothetical protein [Solicola sp. PLA-1-18]|uniref:hypothetical protein n=1 Tax=Solicola sp. PLA-1-18 TaxID=3380532 RepID=UPI003B7758AA